MPQQTPQTFTALGEMSRVVRSLILRETKTRFGESKFGYFWAFAEPAAYVFIFISIRASIGNSPLFGQSAVLFMITGLLIVRMFLSTASNMLAALSSNRTLLTYPPVKPVDVILSRFILQMLTMNLVVAFFYVGLASAVEFKVVVDPGTFGAGLATTAFLSCGIGTFNATFSILMPVWARIWGLISLPTLLFSGIFYVPRALPPFFQDILWWNPILHCVEWVRTGTYVTYNGLYDPWYPLVVALIFLVGGLLLERIYRFKLLSA